MEINLGSIQHFAEKRLPALGCMYKKSEVSDEVNIMGISGWQKGTAMILKNCRG